MKFEKDIFPILYDLYNAGVNINTRDGIGAKIYAGVIGIGQAIQLSIIVQW